jgi:hypothetical protein
VSGLKTGITIAVYAVNRETGARQEIKPKQHYPWNLPPRAMPAQGTTDGRYPA